MNNNLKTSRGDITDIVYELRDITCKSQMFNSIRNNILKIIKTINCVEDEPKMTLTNRRVTIFMDTTTATFYITNKMITWLSVMSTNTNIQPTTNKPNKGYSILHEIRRSDCCSPLNNIIRNILLRKNGCITRCVRRPLNDGQRKVYIDINTEDDDISSTFLIESNDVISYITVEDNRANKI